MFEKLGNIFRIPELRKRVLFTILIMVLYRFGATIPTPGINLSLLSKYFAQHAGGVLNMFDVFAGGAFKKFSIFALGIMPYISSSIILQLLTIAVPSLERLSKEGEAGRKKINQYTRYGTVLIAGIQSFGVAMWIKGFRVDSIPVVSIPDFSFVLLTMLTIITGTIILMWLGELITEFGIGNGISLIIFAGIVARLPSALLQMAGKIQTGEFNPVFILLITLVFVGIVAFIILIEQGQRRIPVQYAQRVVGRKVYSGQNTHLPLKINPSGVIPIIFAAAIMMAPAQLGRILGTKIAFFNTIASWLVPGTPLYLLFYGLLIVFFVYFYTAVQFNPVELADNLKKYGGFIPGIRPGENTVQYIQHVLNRILLSGAISLAVIAIIPTLLQKFMHIPMRLAFLMGGTSLMIIVGVDLDTMKQIESHLLMRHYDGLIKSGKIRGRWK